MVEGFSFGHRFVVSAAACIIRCVPSSVVDPDPGSGAFMTPGSGSGKNNPARIPESLETFFGVKILIFLNADPGSGMEKN